MFASLDPYCQPTNEQITENEARLIDPYNHTEPIANLFKRFSECQDFARSVNNPYSPAQLEQKLLHHMGATGIYTDAIEEWEAKASAQPTWQEAQKFWLKQYLKKRRCPTSTMGGAGFNNNQPFAALAEEETDDDDISVINEGFSALMAENTAQRATIAQLSE